MLPRHWPDCWLSTVLHLAGCCLGHGGLFCWIGLNPPALSALRIIREPEATIVRHKYQLMTASDEPAQMPSGSFQTPSACDIIPDKRLE